MEENKKAIIIDLEKSLFAHNFENEQQVHQEELDRAIALIKKQLSQTEEGKEPDVFLNHLYRTIGVFGDRGSGKTSFMISLLNRCKKEMPKVEVLRMIDPTLVEHKKPIVLCVIAMIQQLVEEKLLSRECVGTGEAYEERRSWNKVMTSVSKGLFAIDKVGRDYDDPLWQDEAYVQHTGLGKVCDANRFEESFRVMVQAALDILDKDALHIVL